MFNLITRFFDKLEDKVRAKLSHRSIIYALIGGVMVVLFWRGVWHTADILMSQNDILGWIFYEPITLLWASAILLLTGLFVSSFIGERIVISGLRREKKVTDQTEAEVQEEEARITRLEKKLDALTKEIVIIKDEVVKK